MAPTDNKEDIAHTKEEAAQTKEEVTQTNESASQPKEKTMQIKEEKASPPLVSSEARELQYACFQHLTEVLSKVHGEMTVNKEYSDWKMLDVQALVHTYLEAAEEMKHIPEEDQGRAIEFTSKITDKVLRRKRDVDLLRTREFSLLRAKHLLRSTDMWKRWVMANVAGTAVVIPMIIMTKAFPNKVASVLNASIVTVCISVVLFASFIAWTSNSTHQEVATAVATYAAVLVVFVGVFVATPCHC
ncbi:hypothetical protein B0J14DRAFT_2708 [Halenospora varia]|nr:hypothetical protein B0J14DRAFT_2708 [Halenospora varia]